MRGDENEGEMVPPRFRPFALSFAHLSRSLEQATVSDFGAPPKSDLKPDTSGSIFPTPPRQGQIPHSRAQKIVKCPGFSQGGGGGGKLRFRFDRRICQPFLVSLSPGKAIHDPDICERKTRERTKLQKELL